MDRDGFFDMIERVTRGRFAAGDSGTHGAKLLAFLSNDQVAVIVDPPSSDLVAAVAVDLLKHERVVGVGFVSEAWMVARSPRAGLECMPSQAPDRTSCIVATWYSRAMHPAMMVIPITNDRSLGDAYRPDDAAVTGGALMVGIGGWAH